MNFKDCDSSFFPANNHPILNWRTLPFQIDIAVAYLLFLKMKTQKHPAMKNRIDILKKIAGKGISPADK